MQSKRGGAAGDTQTSARLVRRTMYPKAALAATRKWTLTRELLTMRVPGFTDTYCQSRCLESHI